MGGHAVERLMNLSNALELAVGPEYEALRIRGTPKENEENNKCKKLNNSLNLKMSGQVGIGFEFSTKCYYM